MQLKNKTNSTFTNAVTNSTNVLTHLKCVLKEISVISMIIKIQNCKRLPLNNLILITKKKKHIKQKHRTSQNTFSSFKYFPSTFQILRLV